ncbi:alcohol acetyltransferase [Sphaerospermopsis aphanizomenoides BCCUSP55]|uniref:phthiocerol/phthiodiolone dimycocerosyl transferase family protein n=1 Tax=Sphaerospermopsis aphanizomenoides TaxID=459663 RepID=UPI000B2EA8F8|nr:condensation domain-containing protein [Sphaerospermopsis aphanizomenoides]MBK1986543.1 alcohol acetyltransferase [Sphaerospermopsis aphanizomenoides BCCUSP55]
MPDNRKLSSLEGAMEILNRRAKTWNIITISRIKGDLQEAVLRPTLDILQHRHSRLNSCIIRFRNNFYFQTAGTKKIPLRIVNDLPEKQWQEIVNQEMNQEIESHKCLMRVVLVHTLDEPNLHYLITTIHHAISDGLSSIQIHSEILEYYQQLASGGTIQPVTTLEALPPIEKLLPKNTQGWRGNLSSILLSLKIGILKLYFQPQALGFEKYVPIPKRRSEIIHKQLDADLTQMFVYKCKQEQTTVHSALCAVLMLTVARKIFQFHQKNVQVSCLSHLDLRRRFQPSISEDNLAILATSLIGFHDIKSHTSFWELAREVKQTLETGMSNGDIFKMVLIANQLINFCFLFPQQIAATVSLSNIGKVNIPNIYGELELEEISFAGSHALYAGMFILHAATFQEKMLLNFAFSQPAISRETMEELVEQTMEHILNISSDTF